MNSSSSSSPLEPATGSIKTLLQELREEGTRLFRKEVELAKTEMTEKATALGRHAASISIGGAVAYAGLIVMLFGLGDLVAMLLINAGIGAAMAAWIGRLSIGLLVALVGWMMFVRAKKAVKSDDLVPEQTLGSLRENKQWMQNKLEQSHEPN